jgi:hypothetical protein
VTALRALLLAATAVIAVTHPTGKAAATFQRQPAVALADDFSRTSLDGLKWMPLWGDRRLRGGRLELSSVPPSSAAQTFSSLVVSRQTWKDMAVSLDTTTVAQLRRPAPNPWEVSWLLFRYSDLAHYYWLILKPNGWELGKKDGGPLDGSAPQRFLATGSAPTFPIGRRYHVRLTIAGGTIAAAVNGRQLFRYTDPDPLPGGAVGFYEEDSVVAFDNVSVTAGPG